MEGKREFDSYKYEVMTDNGITIEQEHMIFKDFSPKRDESVKLKVKGKHQKPYDIDVEPPSMKIDPYEAPIFAPEESKDIEEILNSFAPEPSVSDVVPEPDKTIFELIGNYVSEYSITFLFLAIILTMVIIFSIYLRTKKKGGFDITKFK